MRRGQRDILGAGGIHMPQLDRDGVKIYYEVHGKGDPLILYFGGNAE